MRATAKADLHVHTTASDGTLSPSEVVQLARARGLAAIAITDHDEVRANLEGAEAGARTGIEVVPGIELSCDTPDSEVHILGYFIDPNDGGLTDLLRKVRRYRLWRARLMLRKLNESGVALTWEDVTSHSHGDFVGRGALFRAMRARGLLPRDRERQVFNYYLGRSGGKAYVAHYDMSPAEAVRVVAKAGGVAVVAHPFNTTSDEVIADLAAGGLGGIECWYPGYSQAVTQHYLDLCARLGLVATGGTDFHGPGSGRDDTLGTATVDIGHVEMLRERAKRS